MILRSINFDSEKSTAEDDVLESVVVRVRGREREYLLALVDRTEFDHLVPDAAGVRREIRVELEKAVVDGYARLPAKSVLFLAAVTGSLNDERIEAILPESVWANSVTYDTLVYGVINRLWGDGIDAARKEILG